MICEFKVKNYGTFSEEVSVSFYADMRTKRLSSNCLKIGNRHLVKTLGVYGPNNTGKSSLIMAMFFLQRIMSGDAVNNCFNLFGDNTVTEFEIVYYVNERKYRYHVNYDSKDCIILSELLERVRENPSNPFDVSNEHILFRDSKTTSFGEGTAMPQLMGFVLDRKRAVMSVLNFEKTPIAEAQKDYFEFLKSLFFIDMNHPINAEKTMRIMQDDQKGKEFIVNFVKNCDLNIEDFGYDKDIRNDVDVIDKIAEAIQAQQPNSETLKLWSQHFGKTIPSYLIDSVGTRKLVSLSGYIYEALRDGKTLIVDELDGSLHHILTRAIVALFNNQLNKKAQLLFTTHDLMLLDLKTLMRKDQILLTNINKDKKTSTITSLSSFTAQDGIRGDENIAEYYLKGKFGSIPTPELFDVLVEVTKK